MATANIPQGADIIGAVVPRIDGPLKTTGTARYSADHDFPNLVHAVAVQSTIGKGRIRSLDASAAESMPGVLLVLHQGNINAGGVGFGDRHLAAPQAGLMASLAQGIVGGDMAWPLIVAGILMGIAMIMIGGRVGGA